MGQTMTIPAVHEDVRAILDDAAGNAEVRNNCMFQLCMMLARVSIEGGAEDFKEEAAQRLLAILRDKPVTNVIPLFRRNAASSDAL